MLVSVLVDKQRTGRAMIAGWELAHRKSSGRRSPQGAMLLYLQKLSQMGSSLSSVTVTMLRYRQKQKGKQSARKRKQSL